MNAPRRLSLPLLVALLVGIPVYWAFPSGLAGGRAAGIVAGWVGCGLLLSSLLLMLREIRLAALFGGVERMTRWHHATGLAAYLCLLLHPLALAADDWQESPRLAWELLSPPAESWPVWTGWLGLVLIMLGLAATFATRLRYDRWRALHGLLGLGGVVGLLHVLLLGVSIGAALAVAVALLLLVWRLVRIDAGTAAQPYVVQSVRPVAAAMVEIALAPLALTLEAEPGQFVMVAFDRGAHYRGCREFHPFTIAGHGPGRAFRIGVKALGDCTRRMQGLEAGVAARVLGPYGNFLGRRPDRPQFWVAGGIGITPFLAALRSEGPSRPTILLYLFRCREEAAFLDELEALARDDARLTLDAVATGQALPDLERLLPTAETLADRECFLCGPPGLVAKLAEGLAARGVPQRDIHFESFDFR